MHETSTAGCGSSRPTTLRTASSSCPPKSRPKPMGQTRRMRKALLCRDIARPLDDLGPAGGLDGRGHVLLAVAGVDGLLEALDDRGRQGQLDAGGPRRLDDEAGVLGREVEAEARVVAALEHHLALRLGV